MFARSVTVQLKPNSVAEFNRTMEKDILPVLQKQKGFQDAITLVASNGSEAIGISLWDQKLRRGCLLPQNQQRSAAALIESGRGHSSGANL